MQPQLYISVDQMLNAQINYTLSVKDYCAIDNKMYSNVHHVISAQELQQ